MILELMGAIAAGEDTAAAAERLNIDRRWLRRCAFELLTAMPRSCEDSDAARAAWDERLHGRVRSLGLAYAVGMTERRYSQTRAGATWQRCLSKADGDAQTAATVQKAKAASSTPLALSSPGRPRLHPH